VGALGLALGLPVRLRGPDTFRAPKTDIVAYR